MLSDNDLLVDVLLYALCSISLTYYSVYVLECTSTLYLYWYSLYYNFVLLIALHHEHIFIYLFDSVEFTNWLVKIIFS